MLFRTCPIVDAKIIEPTPIADGRGRFMRAWCQTEFAGSGIDFNPVQANMGLSRQTGTIRGLHSQVAPALEAKLVRCTRGAMFDVVVDLRPASQSYCAWYGVVLSAENGHMLYLPEGCAHGCQSLEGDTEFYYLTSARYSPDDVRGSRFDDPAFGIQWPLPAAVVSAQDQSWPRYDKEMR